MSVQCPFLKIVKQKCHTYLLRPICVGGVSVSDTCQTWERGLFEVLVFPRRGDFRVGSEVLWTLGKVSFEKK